MARVNLKSQLEQAQEEIKVLKAALEKLLQNSEVVSTPHTPEVLCTSTHNQQATVVNVGTPTDPHTSEVVFTPQPEFRTEPQPKPKPTTQQPSPRIQDYRIDKEQRIKTLNQARMAWRTIDQEHRTYYMQSLGKKFLTNDDLLHFFTTVYPTLKPPLTQP